VDRHRRPRPGADHAARLRLGAVKDLRKFFTPSTPRPPILWSRPERDDANDIARAVSRHCQAIGLDESNTIAAIAWAMKEPGHTLLAVRAGYQRADALLDRVRRCAPVLSA
jgi:hypothetical protein